MEIENNPENSDKLPTGQPATPFEQIVADSKNKIAAEAQAQIKRGRGRPKGSTKKGSEGSSVNPEKPTGDSESASARDITNEIRPLLKDAIKTPFSLAGDHFKNPDIEISDTEAETPSFYLSKWLQLAMPELEGQNAKTFNLYAFGLSMFLLLLKKIPKMRSKGPAIDVTAERMKSEPTTRTEPRESQEPPQASQNPNSERQIPGSFPASNIFATKF